MQDQGPYCELFPVFNEFQIVGVPLPPSPMETVQVVVPDQRDGCYEDGWQHQVPERQAKQVILLGEGTGGVDVGYPDIHKQFYDVSDDRESPRNDLPTGPQAGADGGVIRRGGGGVMVWGGEAA